MFTQFAGHSRFWGFSPEERGLKAEVSSLREQVGNLRRGIFSRHDKLKGEIEKLQEELGALKKESFQIDFFRKMEDL